MSKNNSKKIYCIGCSMEIKSVRFSGKSKGVFDCGCGTRFELITDDANAGSVKIVLHHSGSLLESFLPGEECSQDFPPGQPKNYKGFPLYCPLCKVKSKKSNQRLILGHDNFGTVRYCKNLNCKRDFEIELV